MDSRFALIGRACEHTWDAAPPPRRSPEAFPASQQILEADPSAWRAGLRPLLCLGAFAIALWPHWRWAAARLADGSDDPLGLAALAVLAVAIARLAPRLRASRHRSGWPWRCC